jgi:Zn-dependent peptidase ImmA (M78 family)
MTLAHELGHNVLYPGAGFARMTRAESIPAYRSSEWQANAFGGELLISADHIHKCRNLSEAVLMFGVSLDAAAVQWKAFGRKGLI